MAGAEVDPLIARMRVTGIVAHSRDVAAGNLFVAIPGTRGDGHAFVSEAVRRGACAVVVEREVDSALAVPAIHVPSSRRALAELAACWYGHPADRLSLIGITGTVGKTSILSMLEAILRADRRRVATIGSLGARIDGGREHTDHTTPEPLVLHETLARAVAAGFRLAATEVTSHALAQERIHGFRFGLGIFTNLLPLEHEDYHGSFRAYVEAKARFFDHLPPGAHLVYPSDNLALRGLVAGRNVTAVGCGRTRSAMIQKKRLEMSIDGTRLWLSVRQPLPRVDGLVLAPFSLSLSLRILGHHNHTNASLAAVAALCLGIEPATVQTALASLPSAPRRMEILHRGRFTVLDDTVGHPQSISALFLTVRHIRYKRLRAVVAVRGRRGPLINHRLAESLAIWAKQFPLSTLVVTRSQGAVDDRNAVTDQEHTAFLAGLRRGQLAFEQQNHLDDAVTAVLERARRGDLVLMLGAQGMDAGAAVVRGWVAAHE